MPIIFKNNAYHILGLDTSCSEKDVLKRSKEILNRIKADDAPIYDLDIGLFSDFRTEDSVKDALQIMQAPKKRIKEYFFWFQIADGVDEQALGLIKLKDYSNAIRIWENASEGQNTKAYFYKKNLAILYCLMLSIQDSESYLRSSLILWKELINSDKFWSSFSKVYKLHDEQTASEDIVSSFRNNVVDYLSDIYTELYKIQKNADYINEFQKVFSSKGKKIEEEVLNPAYRAISAAVEGLEAAEVSKNEGFSKEKSENIKQLIGIIQQELNKLIDLSLYDDSQTKIMRDRAANAIRTIVLDLHNNLNEYNKSLQLLHVAIQFCGTDSLKGKLETEIQQIEKSISDEAENSLDIEIPESNGAILFVKNDYFEYENQKIFYKDIESISYHSTKNTTSIYYIPVSTTHSYDVTISTSSISKSFSFSGGRNNEERQQIFGRLIAICGHLVEPLLIKKLESIIFDKGEMLKIGGIEFTKEGYSRYKSAWFGTGERQTVAWTDKVYVPIFSQGSVFLFKDNQATSREFASVPMSTPNAVIIPGLVKACVARF